jgi:hypothetical protein
VSLTSKCSNRFVVPVIVKDRHLSASATCRGPSRISTYTNFPTVPAFDPHEREPADNLKLAFEATQHLTPEEQAVVLQLIEAMLLKHEARRWAS